MRSVLFSFIVTVFSFFAIAQSVTAQGKVHMACNNQSSGNWHFEVMIDNMLVGEMSKQGSNHAVYTFDQAKTADMKVYDRSNGFDHDHEVAKTTVPLKEGVSYYFEIRKSQNNTRIYQIDYSLWKSKYEQEEKYDIDPAEMWDF